MIAKLTRVVLLFFALLYTTTYVFWRILLLTPLYERYWQLQLSEVFGSWVYLPLPLLLIFVGLTRHRRAALVLLLPCCFFGAEYGRQFLPNWQHWSADPTARTVRVMTWNMLYASDHKGEFKETITDLQPDIIALQEVGRGMDKKFDAEYRDVYPYQTVYGAGRSNSLALLSRFPILETQVSAGIWECRCLHAVIDLEGRSIHLLVVHIPSPLLYIARYKRLPEIRLFDNEHQTPAFDMLLEKIDSIQAPLLVMGDLNTAERQPNYRRLRHYLEEAFGAAGWGMGYTFPAHAQHLGFDLPAFVRIDHILYNTAWRAPSAWTGRLAASDHRYVVADLVLSSMPMDDKE